METTVLEQTTPLQRLEEKVFKQHTNAVSISISRVPKDTATVFFELAEKEFCSDRGMCLKWLMDGIPNQHIQVLHDRISMMEEQLNNLRNTLQPPKEEPERKIIKLLNGNTILGANT